jgi:hypothetical protein
MPSVTEQRAVHKTRARYIADLLEIWNRKLHYYTGLYLLLFVWLFAFTGLLLNHPEWSFDEFWPNRTQSDSVVAIHTPPPLGDLAQARDIMRQLGIVGEVEWTVSRSDPSMLTFQTNRPGHASRISADLRQNRVTLHRDDLNAWGVMHVLHTFTGVRLGDSRNQRDWVLTTVWALSMDGIAAGLVFMVFSSLYMWYGLKGKRKFGMLSLGTGTLACGLFAIGLRWMTS